MYAFTLLTFVTFQVHCNDAGGGEGTNAGEDIHMVCEGTTTLYKVQDRDERQVQDSGQKQHTALSPFGS